MACTILQEGDMEQVAIIGATRTPVGAYMGALTEVRAYDLAALVLAGAVRNGSIESEQVDQVIMGQSYQSREYVNIARMAPLKAGWPESIPGITLDRRCCAGLDVVCFAGMMIQSGNAEIVVAGGVDSMSTAEF
jgi:acetyl-CoA C-acetyltransferase